MGSLDSPCSPLVCTHSTLTGSCHKDQSPLTSRQKHTNRNKRGRESILSATEWVRKTEMANSLGCFFPSPPPTCYLQSPNKSPILTDFFFPISDQSLSSLGQKIPVFHTCKSKSFQIQATDGNQTTKSNSILCPNCEGKGAVACSQCKGGGVNLIDHFNGQFKVGDSCWLCSGKNLILCGECNGAGFLGGFLSTQDQ